MRYTEAQETLLSVRVNCKSKCLMCWPLSALHTHIYFQNILLIKQNKSWKQKTVKGKETGFLKFISLKFSLSIIIKLN